KEGDDRATTAYSPARNVCFLLPRTSAPGRVRPKALTESPMSSMSSRLLLGGLGGSLLAGTFCDRLVAPARAGSSMHAKRLIVLFTPDATYQDYWTPDVDGGGSFSFEGASMLEPLASHKDDLILLEGLDV